MKRMWSKNELKNIADTQAKAVKKDIATLVDKDGHERFIEWDINIPETITEGVTKEYGKASLSGTHLLMVLAIRIPNATEMATQYLGIIVLPKWINDKIVTWFGNQVRAGTFQARASNGTSQNIAGSLRKTSDENTFGIYLDNAFTASAERVAIFNFDLLIDNA